MDIPVPSLVLLPSLSAVHGSLYGGNFHLPRERPVDRALLATFAPDREDAMTAAPGIDAMRNKVKLKGKQACVLIPTTKMAY